MLISGDQGERRRKRHLETRVDDGLRRDQQDNDGGNSKCPECERRAIHHHADQHDRDHDKRALRGNFGAGKQR